MPREFEKKYEALPRELAAIRERFGSFTEIAMETAYFDTPEGALRKRHWMLRLRLENGKAVCTLKTPLPDGSRQEWEVENSSLDAAVLELCKLGGPRELLSLTGLQKVCAARFTRLASLLELPQCTVELALDQGVFLGGGREQPFSELEVELKQGSEEAAAAFAADLAREYGLREEPKSKVQRALALAGL